MKKLLLVLIFISFMSTSSVMAQDIFEESQYRKPVVETLNLRVDGSITPVFVNITVNFDYIARVIWNFDFTDNEIDYDAFGSSVALTNGTSILYDGIEIVEPIKTIHGFSHTSYDLRIDSDDKNPKDNHLVSRLTFWKYVPPNGLKMKEGHTFQVKIMDNLTSVGSSFLLVVEGFKDMHIEPDFKRDWLEDSLIVDTPIKLVLFPFVMPLALIFTWDAPIVLMGLGLYFIEFFTLYKIISSRRY